MKKNCGRPSESRWRWRLKCESCGDSVAEGYRITLKLCHDCMVDLEEWLESRKRHG